MAMIIRIIVVKKKGNNNISINKKAMINTITVILINSITINIMSTSQKIKKSFESKMAWRSQRPDYSCPRMRASPPLLFPFQPPPG